MTMSVENRHVLAEYARTQKVRLGLQGTSQPINQNSHDIEWLAEGLGEAGINDLARSTITLQGPMPYGVTLLPYRLLERFSHDGQPPVIPDSPETIEAAIDSFWPGDYNFPRTWHGKLIEEKIQSDTHDVLRRILVEVGTSDGLDSTWARAVRSLVGKAVEPRQWQQYTNAHHRQVESGLEYTLDEMSQVAMSNFGFNEKFGVFQELVGRHKSFIYSSSADGLHLPVLSRVRIPIGPYGRPPAEKLALTAVFMSQFDEQDYDLINGAVSPETERAIRQHTTRANGYDPPLLADSFVAGLREADQQAMPGALAFLTSSRVKGYDPQDYDKLINDLIADDLVNELALHARQGLVASVAMYGLFVPDVVAVKPDGHLAISSQGIDRLQALKEISDSVGVAELQTHNEAMTQYELAYEVWEQNGRAGGPPEQPGPLIRTWTYCPYAGINRSGETPEPGAISQRSPATLAVYKCMQPLTTQERRRPLVRQHRPPFGRLIDQLRRANDRLFYIGTGSNYE